MDERLNLGSDIRELKLGSTFGGGNNGSRTGTSFHTLKYDFKPASVDLSKVATLDVSSNNQVTVTVPHLDSSGVPKTVFKGNQRNYTKECVLIIDKVTGEITLEKLHHNIQVKKTRSENVNKTPALPPQLPPSARGSLENSTQRTVSKTKVSTGYRKSAIHGVVQRHSPIQGSPSYPHHKSPQQAPAWIANNSQSTLPSIPLIGMDDDIVPPPQSSNSVTSIISEQQQQQSYQNYHHQSQPQHQPQHQPQLHLQQQHYQQSQMHHSSGINTLMPSTIANSAGASNNHHPQQQHQNHHHQNNHNHHHNVNNNSQQLQQGGNEVGVLSSSDSSSDSESSGSGSDSDDPAVNNHQTAGNMKSTTTNNHSGVAVAGSLPAMLLNEDLRLSDSNSSDSDD